MVTIVQMCKALELTVPDFFLKTENDAHVQAAYGCIGAPNHGGSGPGVCSDQRLVLPWRYVPLPNMWSYRYRTCGAHGRNQAPYSLHCQLFHKIQQGALRPSNIIASLEIKVLMFKAERSAPDDAVYI